MADAFTMRKALMKPAKSMISTTTNNNIPSTLLGISCCVRVSVTTRLRP